MWARCLFGRACTSLASPPCAQRWIVQNIAEPDIMPSTEVGWNRNRFKAVQPPPCMRHTRAVARS